MCRPFAVSCLRRGDYSTDISDHIHISSTYKVPCKNAGTSACKWDVEPSADFQISPTECAGELAGHDPASAEGKAICRRSLEKYADAVYRMNTEGPGRKSRVAKWLKGWVSGKEEEKGKKRLELEENREMDSSA